jgi:hypothetical protein
MLDKARRWARIAGVSLLQGMKGADDVISAQIDPRNQSTINQSQSRGGVLQEMLEEEQTQRVKELRDEYYRILRAAEQIHVDVDPTFLKEEWDEEVDGNKLYAFARKKTASDFIQHAKVYEGDNLPIKVIQDNVKIEKKSALSSDESEMIALALDKLGKDDFDYLTLLDVRRDGFIPSFKLEKLVKRIVVKKLDNEHSIVELYLPAEPPQFSPIGSTIINKMKGILENKRYRDPLLDMSGFDFITEKPWTDKGCHSNEKFSYCNAKVEDIVVFDGNIVVRYKCDNEVEYEYVGDKFKMKEVDEKYENIQLREGAAPTIGAIERRDEYLKNLNNSIQEDTNENSD